MHTLFLVTSVVIFKYLCFPPDNVQHYLTAVTHERSQKEKNKKEKSKRKKAYPRSLIPLPMCPFLT